MKKKALYFNKLLGNIRIKNISFIKENKLNFIICVPLSIGNKVKGVLSLYGIEEIYDTDDVLNLLLNICSQSAIVLENSRLFKNLKNSYFETIAALAASIDAKDHYTHGHSQKVMEYSVEIAKEMGLSEEEITNIKFAGLLHDVGKIGIDDSILKKETALTPEERKEIEKHPVYGYKIVEKIEFLKKARKYIYHHHERWDGKGYPEGLKGENIPLGARIISVADTYDAMTSSRSYRKALPEYIAIEEIKEHSGSQFDPQIVKVFLKIIERKIRINKMKILRDEKLSKIRKI